MVVIEGNSRPQNQAIALAVEDAVLLEYQQQTIKQGKIQPLPLIIGYCMTLSIQYIIGRMLLEYLTIYCMSLTACITLLFFRPSNSRQLSYPLIHLFTFVLL